MCKSCASKQQLKGYALNRRFSKATTPCEYTFEQIAEKLQELKTSGINSFHISYLKSALNLYHKNCNLFNDKLSKVFQQ